MYYHAKYLNLPSGCGLKRTIKAKRNKYQITISILAIFLPNLLKSQ